MGELTLSEISSLISDLETYLDQAEEVADHEMAKLRSKAEKKFRESDKRLEVVLTDGKLFKEDMDNPDISAMDKYSHRIYEKVESTINSIEKPQKFTLRSLKEYAENSRSALLAQDEILIKYVKLLKGAKYKKRVKSLSNSLKKLNKDLTKLERFITDEYTPFSDIENNVHVIQDAVSLLKRYDTLFYDVIDKEDSVISKSQELKEVRSQLSELKQHPQRQLYQNAVDDYSRLQKDLDLKFSNIKKALRKYENIASKSKERMDTTLLKDLIKDTLNCLANQSSIASIENLLRSTQDMMKDASLKLKKDKREAAQKDITELLEGKLAEYWNQARSNRETKEKTKQELDDLELDFKINRLNSSLEASKRDRNRLIERELRDLEKVTENLEKVNADLKLRLKSIVGDDFSIMASIPQLPNWVDFED